MDHLTAPRFAHQTDAVSLSCDHALPLASDAAAGRMGGLTGCWTLAAGRALTLQARQAGVLRIAHGRVWLTFSNAGNDLRVRAGDHFLSRSESLSLSAGETVVLESYGLGHASSAYFSWEPARASCGEAAGRDAAAPGVRGLLQGAGRALTRVATAFAIGFIAARDRCALAERPFNAQTCK